MLRTTAGGGVVMVRSSLGSPDDPRPSMDNGRRHIAVGRAVAIREDAMERRVRRVSVLAGVAASVAVIASPSAVSAECTQVDGWPSFRTAARTAKTIVIGRVVESFDPYSDTLIVAFALRVDEVLRGRASQRLEFRGGVRSGLPLTLCPSDSILRVSMGDRLAMAFDATYPGATGPVTAIAFLRRTPDPNLMPGMERLTVDQVRFVSSLPETDTEPIATKRAAPLSWLPGLLGVIGGLTFLRLRRWARYPDGRWPSSSRPSATNAVSGTRV